MGVDRESVVSVKVVRRNKTYWTDDTSPPEYYT